MKPKLPLNPGIIQAVPILPMGNVTSAFNPGATPGRHRLIVQNAGGSWIQSIAAAKQRNRGRTVKSLKTYLILAGLGSLVFTQPLFAQAGPTIGSDNPGGPNNEYNGSTEVAGTLDPYTGSARREINDIVVPGSIGAYPLKFTRILTTRGGGAPNQFGEGGGWTHSYNWLIWSIADPNYCEDGHYCGPLGGVNYPEGGKAELWDGIEDTVTLVFKMNGKHGPADQVHRIDSTRYELWRADGGKVVFLGTPNSNGFNFRAYQIIDPYGQVTTLSYDSQFRLNRVTEPGGRYLEFFYKTYSSWTQTNPPMQTSEDVIWYVTSNDGRGNVIETVTYDYTPAWIQTPWGGSWTYNLTTVSYDDGSQASYTYEAANTDYMWNSIPNSSPQVVHSCDDPRYAGPMKQIQYQYVQRGEAVPDYVGRGHVKAEKNQYGQVVTQISWPTWNGDPARLHRTETRGDGPSRSFTYSDEMGGDFSTTSTDFKGQITTDTTLFSLPGWSITDPRQNTTTYQTDGYIGAVKKIIYPQTNPSLPAATKEYTFTDNDYPCFHATEKDENGHTTTFVRDTFNRVSEIQYPDGTTEHFDYNGFGQVTAHRLRSGGTETFTYDARGLKTLSWPPATSSDGSPAQHPTQYIYYTSGPNTDRVYMVIDPLQHATAYEYNQRGQVTKVQHHDYTYSQSGYNTDGTLAWTADENHPGAATDPNQRTRYTYDEYKRVLTVTNPMGETTTNYYGLDWANPLLHTTNTVKYTLSPMQKNVVFDYDENLRKTAQTVAAGTSDIATTWFEYDSVGNLTRTTDPRGNATTFDYDQRNRKIWMNNPISTDRNSNGHTMEWEYDGVGNKLKETRADNAFRSWEYDVPNRITRAIDWRMSLGEPAVTTTNTRDLPILNRGLYGTVERTIDAKGAEYKSEFDALHRKTAMTYPLDATSTVRSEGFWYDFAGNLTRYKNPSGKYNHMDFADSYDSRNRLKHSAWTASSTSMTPDWSIGQEIVTSYDNASRVTSIVTNGGETTVAYGYDAANRKIYEDQTLAGYPTRRVDTPVDADGNRTSLTIGTVYQIRYDYTLRNQLDHIYGGGWEPWFNYDYDAAGNLTKRQALLGGANDSINVLPQWYDALNRPTVWENTKAGDTWFTRSNYQYDKVGRETATWRDEDNGLGASRGERFTYTPTNQLSSAKYNAQNVWSKPISAERWVNYSYTPDMLNRSSVTENDVVTNYSSPSGINQYGAVNGEAVNYDPNFNIGMHSGWFYYYDAQNRLTTVRDYTGALLLQNTYDALGRCVKRDRHDWGTFVELITYDGWKPTVEWDGAGNFKAWNIYGPGPDEILWRYQNDVGHTRYHHDRQGNVIALLDWNGNVLERYSYDAFGRPKVVDGGDTSWQNPRTWSSYGNRFMFTGREYFAGLWLYDYRHRWYDAQLGRFLQVDPLGLQTEGVKLSAGQKGLFWAGQAPEAFSRSEMNLFRYCGDDPVDQSDPLGLELDAVYSISKQTFVVTNLDNNEKIILRGSSGTNRVADEKERDTGPVPRGPYSMYDRGPDKNGASRYILDANDPDPHNDTLDGRSKEQGGGRYAFRIHEEAPGNPRKGSDGCIVLSPKDLKRLDKMARETSKGPRADIQSDGRKPNEISETFQNRDKIGTVRVVR